MAKHITLLLILVVVPSLQSNSLQVDEPFDFKQIKKDSEAITVWLKSEEINFNFNKPAHKYYTAINILDVATTVYGVQNRNNLYEANILLPKKPSPEEIIAQKLLISYLLGKMGIFTSTPTGEAWLSIANTTVTAATINNYILIKKYD